MVLFAWFFFGVLSQAKYIGKYNRGPMVGPGGGGRGDQCHVLSMSDWEDKGIINRSYAQLFFFSVSQLLPKA